MWRNKLFGPFHNGPVANWIPAIHHPFPFVHHVNIYSLLSVGAAIYNTAIWPNFCANNRWSQCIRSYLELSSIRNDADKSLARQGRKQTTATKFEIYSTYSPRSSIHFLARCFNVCKPLKLNSDCCLPNRSPRQQWPPRRKKNGDLSIIFSVQGTGGSTMGPDLENRVGDQDIGI